MRLSIHIGLPKTGTTSFQNYLVAGYSQAPRDGIWYPNYGFSGNDYTHSWLRNGLRLGDVGMIQNGFKKFDARAEHIILSDENIYVETPGLPIRTRANVERFFSDYDIQIIAVRRKGEKWLKSFYVQAVELRRSSQKVDYFSAKDLWETPLKMADFYKGYYAKQLLRPTPLVEQIADYTNATSVLNVDYRSGHDIVTVLKPLLNLKWQPPVPLERKNTSLSDVEAEVQRQANGQAPVHSRMIRALIYSLGGRKPRPKQIDGMRDWLQGYHWDFAYTKNPPLKYSRQSFDTLIDKLKDEAARLTA